MEPSILSLLPPVIAIGLAIATRRILSSIGSGIHLIDHVTTQIPYALVCATASLAGFIVLGFTRSSTVGLLTALAALTVAVFVLRSSFASETQRRSEVGRTAGSGRSTDLRRDFQDVRGACQPVSFLFADRLMARRTQAFCTAL